MDTQTITRNSTQDIVYIGLFAVLMAICSWIFIPTAVPFTMQTFGVFLAVGVLGGKRGFLAVLVYLLLGLSGIPVFSGFTAGVGILLGNTGGYLAGFLFSALAMWGIEKLAGRRTWALALSMTVGLIVCYAFGTVWFMVFYAHSTGAIGLGTVLAWCVLPFVIPDMIKLVLALSFSKRLSGILFRR